jgi:allantoicase
MSWRELPDLAVRSRGGSVVLANDETFGEKENLIKPAGATFQPYTFGNRGQVVDGWETRRRREAGHDWAIVRLGLPGLVRGVVVDTSWFTGNHPQECSLEGAWIDPLGPAVDVEAARWAELVPASSVGGDRENPFEVRHDRLVSHVRLRQFPDGGVARLRVHGEPVGDPRWAAGRTLDLAAAEHGARIADCSNRFYSAPENLLTAGPARVMGEGWETSRRRDTGNDWVVVELAAPGVISHLEIDTSCFVGNAPGEASVRGLGPERVELLPRVRIHADSVNRFVLAEPAEVSGLRVDIYPDGGLARVRAYGEPTPAGRGRLFLRWYERLDADAGSAAMTGWGGADEEWAAALAAGRPYHGVAHLREVAQRLPGAPPNGAAWAALVPASLPPSP